MLFIDLHQLIVDAGMNIHQCVVVVQVAGFVRTLLDIQEMLRVLAVGDQVHLHWVIEALRFASPSLEGGRLGGIERCREERS